MAQYNEYSGGEDYGGYEQQQQQRAPPAQYNVRPMQDVDAEGEVDPNL